ncbi:MAG TPA: TrkA family potassium uptake protein [Candidatus Dormibacteraeota bacterium]|nr:TrkA family potassium uptake protein [Candidatus Dormibacteraeota bacterium]
MEYVIVGCGRTGAALARLLLAEGASLTVLDANPAAFAALGDDFRGRLEIGTGVDEDVLRRAGAARADGLAAVTSDDNRNLMCALIARRRFGIARVVARISDPSRAELYDDLDIQTICPTLTAAKQLRDVLSGSHLEPRAIRAQVGTAFAGHAVEELAEPGRVVIGSVTRGQRAFVPAPRDVLEAGDRIVAFVAPEALESFARRLSSGPFAEARG